MLLKQYYHGPAIIYCAGGYRGISAWTAAGLPHG